MRSTFNIEVGQKKHMLKTANNKHRHSTFNESSLIGRAAQIAREKCNYEEQCGMVKELVSNGFWNIPPEQRPSGWENMGVRERNG